MRQPHAHETNPLLKKLRGTPYSLKNLAFSTDYISSKKYNWKLKIVAGTIAAGILTFVSKRLVDRCFMVKKDNPKKKSSKHFSLGNCWRLFQKVGRSILLKVDNPVPFIMICCPYSFFAGLISALITSFVGFFGKMPTTDPSDRTILYAFFTGIGMTAGFFLLLCTIGIGLELYRDRYDHQVDGHAFAV